jgi:hypothetical protein
MKADFGWASFSVTCEANFSFPSVSSSAGASALSFVSCCRRALGRLRSFGAGVSLEVGAEAILSDVCDNCLLRAVSLLDDLAGSPFRVRLKRERTLRMLSLSKMKWLPERGLNVREIGNHEARAHHKGNWHRQREPRVFRVTAQTIRTRTPTQNNTLATSLREIRPAPRQADSPATAGPVAFTKDSLVPSRHESG